MEDLFGAFQNQGQMMQGQMYQDQMIQQGQMMQGQMYQDQMMMQGQMYQDQMMMQGQMYQDPMMAQQYQMMQDPMGSMDRYGNVKFSKAEYLEGLRNYIIRSCNFQVIITKEEKIEDMPVKIRHCCAESRSKIVMLDKLSFDVPITNMHIPFYFCRDCGKLYYYKDFML